MLLREYNKSDVVFKEGDPGHYMYRILEGSVSVTVASGKGKSIELTTLGPDKIFGEMTVLEGWPRSATITVTEDGTKLLEIGRDEIYDFFKQDPHQVEVLMINLSSRIRELTDDYLEVCATLREMDETGKESRKRSEGLLKRIARFISDYSKTVAFLTTADETSQLVPAGQMEKDEDSSAVYRKNTVIFNQNDEGDCMYYVQLGRVAICTDYGKESEKTLTVLGDGTFFGEMGLIEKLPRSATAVALDEDTVLRKITKEELDTLFVTAPSLSIGCLMHMSSRLRSLTKDYLKACEAVSKLDAAEKNGRALTEAEKENAQDIINMAGRRRMFG